MIDIAITIPFATSIAIVRYSKKESNQFVVIEGRIMHLI